MTATQTAPQSVDAPAGVGRPAHRHRRWPYLLALFLVLGLLGGAAAVVYRTSVLALKQVVVTAPTGGLSAGVEDAVRAAVTVPTGTPLVSVNLAAVRREALSVPQVAAASVSRHWPNDLMIVVTQRTPAAVTNANGALWLLDATGFPYLKVTPAQIPAGLLNIELATPGPKDTATAAALAVVGELTAPVKATVASVSARSAYAVTLDLRDGRSVIWGSPDNGAKKAQILAAVLAQPGKTYDISDPDYVSVSH
jgi:cell division protein FtsQ